jgi:hypothetical protein
MGAHGNQDNGKKEKKDDNYQPQHAGGRDGYEWAKEHKAEEKKGK